MVLKIVRWMGFFVFSCIFSVIVFQIKATAGQECTPASEHPICQSWDDERESPEIPATTAEPKEADRELGSCKEKEQSANSACSTSSVTNTVGAAMMPVLSTAAAIGEEDTAKVVCKQGDITKIIGAVNAGVGAYCFAKVKSCVSTCTEVREACKACKAKGFPPSSCSSSVKLGEDDDAETVAYDGADCEIVDEAISACKEFKQAAIMALVQAGILGVTGTMMVNACKDMKATSEEEPPEKPPNAPAPAPGNSPMSVGVSPLSPNKGPGQFAPIKTTTGPKQPGAPEEDPFGEKGEDDPQNPFSSMGSGSNSLGGSPSGGFGGPSGGLPGGGGEDADNDKGEGLLSGNYGGAEGFLSGGSSRRGGSSSRGGRGYSSYPGGGKKKGFGLKDGKDKLGPKREISQFKSRHQSIFEIMSDLIQSFCREGQPVCE